MHIFIDESGGFTDQGDAPISVVGALWVPDARWDSLERVYLRRLRPGLPLNASGEVKGSRLSELQIAGVLRQLSLHESVFTACVVDRSAIGAAIVDAHRTEQGRRITANLTNNPYPAVEDALRALSGRVMALNDQLYVQFVAQCELVNVVLRNALVYHAFRRPREISRFKWIVDSKGDLQVAGAIPIETLWRDLISPFIQSISLREAIPIVEGGDYSYFNEAFAEAELPEYLKPFSSTGGKGAVFNGSAILRDMNFSAQSLSGLEIVDIVTNATRRCLRGALGRNGWCEIPKIMIGRNPCSLNLITLGDAAVVPPGPIREILKDFSLANGLPILPRKSEVRPNRYRAK